jgi:hypothetical protein
MNATIKLSLHVLFLVAVAMCGRLFFFDRQAEILPQIQPRPLQTKLLRKQIDEMMKGQAKIADVKINLTPIFWASQKVERAVTRFEVFIDIWQDKISEKNDTIGLREEVARQFISLNDSIWGILVDLQKTDIPGVKISDNSMERVQNALAFLLENDDLLDLMAKSETKNLNLILAFIKIEAYRAGILGIAFLSDNCGGRDHYDVFDVVSSSAKAKIRLGEMYETQLMIGSGRSYKILSVQVGDTILNVRDHKAYFRTTPTDTGEHSYLVKMIFNNPNTDEKDSCSKVFRFDVIAHIHLHTAKKMPKTAPVPILAELRGGDITREKLIFPITLQSEDERQTVLSFTLWHLQKGEEPKPYKIKSDKIPAYILDKIQAGDQLQFVDIRARNQNNLPTMAFIVGD